MALARLLLNDKIGNMDDEIGHYDPEFDAEVRVPISYFQHFESYFSARGVGLGELLRGTGIATETFHNPQATLSRETSHRLNVRALELSGEPDLPLRMSHNISPTVHGFLGHAMISAPNLRGALRLLERFAGTRGIPLDFRLYESDLGGRLRMRLTRPMGRFRRAYLEWGLMYALSASVSDDVVAADLPEAIWLEFPEPPSIALYQERFHCPVFFNASESAIAFSNSTLDRPAKTSNAEIQAFCEQRCELIRARSTAENRVSTRVLNELLNSAQPFPSIERVAHDLCMGERTLRRQLREEGTSFRALLKDVRERLARKYLEKDELTVEEISVLLGYSEPPAFSRAFKHWTGLSPEHFRRRGSGSRASRS